MALDSSLLNTQWFKVRIKGKVEQSMERSGALPQHLGIVATEKGAFRSPSTTVANFTLIMSVSYLPTPPLGQDKTLGQFLSGV